MRATCQQTTQVVLCFRLVGMLLAVLEHVPLAVGVAAAEGPRFSNVFMSHMVLQHGRPISLWGWGASSHAQLEVSLGNHSTEATVNASDGSWHATLPTMAPTPLGQGLELKVGSASKLTVAFPQSSYILIAYRVVGAAGQRGACGYRGRRSVSVQRPEQH
eukprot:COSAG03_NODE_5294_length_1282_cov_8215.103128_1_plen_160_part_00